MTVFAAYRVLHKLCILQNLFVESYHIAFVETAVLENMIHSKEKYTL